MPKAPTAAKSPEAAAQKKAAAKKKKISASAPDDGSIAAAPPLKKAKKKKPSEMATVVVEPPARSDDAVAKKTKKAVKRDLLSASPEPEQDDAAPHKKKARKEKPAEIAPAMAEAIAAGEKKLDRAQVERAVRALLTHIGKEGKKGLLSLDAPVNVQMSTKQMPKPVGKAAACKPVPLGLPHPFVSFDTTEICLIVKDPQREYKDKLADAGLRARVIGVSKLKKKFHPHEAKRELCATYSVFLADARVLPMLPPLLGKTFFKKRALPTAVDLKKKDLRGELTRAACGTVYRHTAGTSNSIQIGHAEQSASQLVDNVLAAVEQAVARVPGRWGNLQSLNLRTTNSVALPIFNALPHA